MSRWDYDATTDSDILMHGNYRVRAVRDNHAENPFESDEGHWPICVRLPDSGRRTEFTDYAEQMSGDIRNPLARFTDAQLVFNQVHIAKALGFDNVERALSAYFSDNDLTPAKWVTDAGVLREGFDQNWDNDISESELFDACVKLYKLIDIHAYTKQVTGYCQGDWAEVLVVAPPEVVERFGIVTPITDEVLEGTGDVYGWWAWGDVYGYVIEQRAPDTPDDADEDEIEWIEIDSCWGYYGPDHDKSGLEEAALAAIPEKVEA